MCNMYVYVTYCSWLRRYDQRSQTLRHRLYTVRCSCVWFDTGTDCHHKLNTFYTEKYIMFSTVLCIYSIIWHMMIWQNSQQLAWSLPSTQYVNPSHIERTMTHWPLSHRNWPAVQSVNITYRQQVYNITIQVLSLRCEISLKVINSDVSKQTVNDLLLLVCRKHDSILQRVARTWLSVTVSDWDIVDTDQ